MILTYEDCHFPFAGEEEPKPRCGSSWRGWDEVQRVGNGNQRRILAALGLRRALVMMNHITTSVASCREPPKSVLIGQDHRTLVLVPETEDSSFPRRRESISGPNGYGRPWEMDPRLRGDDEL